MSTTFLPGEYQQPRVTWHFSMWSQENLLDLLMMGLVGKLVSGNAEDIFGSDGLDAFPRIAIEQHTGRLVVVESTWKFRTRILETLLIISIITLVKILSDNMKE